MYNRLNARAIPVAIGLLLAGTALSAAQDDTTPPDRQTQNRSQDNLQKQNESSDTVTTSTDEAGKDVDAKELVRDAAGVVEKMKADKGVDQLLDQAKGVYIVPNFGRASLAIAGRGGAGVLLARTENGWSDPAFYDMAGVSLGAQAGVTVGSVAFILKTDQAVEAFKQNNNFSMNAEAGYTIVDYSAEAQASTDDEDAVFWSDEKGAYLGAAVGVSGVDWDEDENRSFYGKKVTPEEITSSGGTAAGKADKLKDALSG